VIQADRYYRIHPSDYSASAMVAACEQEVRAAWNSYRELVKYLPPTSCGILILRDRLETLFDVLECGKQGDWGRESRYHQARQRNLTRNWNREHPDLARYLEPFWDTNLPRYH
jgi:hypothetical protein